MVVTGWGTGAIGCSGWAGPPGPAGGGGGDLGPAMATALVTTLYGCILAHMIFGPIAVQLRQRDEEEVLCKLIIVEGIMSIQSGANPKFLREKLLTFVAQRERGESSKKASKE